MQIKNKSIAKKFWVIGIGGFCWTAAIAEASDPQLLCGVDTVEDLVALPASPWIIGSGIGSPKGEGGAFEGGALHLFNVDTFTGGKINLDLSPDLVAQAPYDQCPAPVDAEKFSAHGLGLKTNGDNSYDLFVVNHGGRESIEVFRVTSADAEPAFKWIGCILSPENSLPNAVAAKADGGIVMSSSGAGLHSYLGQAQAGENTGAVYAWQRDTGWTKIPNSSFPINNGIELSADNQWAYVAAWGNATVVHLPLDPSLGEPQAIQLDFMPDNIRWTNDGQLAVTGHLTTIEKMMACFTEGTGQCIVAYKSALIDPDTLDVSALYASAGTEDFSMATTTVIKNGDLWMGSALGNCVARVSLPSQD